MALCCTLRAPGSWAPAVTDDLPHPSPDNLHLGPQLLLDVPCPCEAVLVLRAHPDTVAVDATRPNAHEAKFVHLEVVPLPGADSAVAVGPAARSRLVVAAPQVR